MSTDRRHQFSWHVTGWHLWWRWGNAVVDSFRSCSLSQPLTERWTSSLDLYDFPLRISQWLEICFNIFGACQNHSTNARMWPLFDFELICRTVCHEEHVLLCKLKEITHILRAHLNTKIFLERASMYVECPHIIRQWQSCLEECLFRLTVWWLPRQKSLASS